MTKESGESARYGRLAEEAAKRKYGLELVGKEWFDGKHKSNGSKVQIKATRRQLASGQSGQFRFWQRDHRRLKKERGSYVLVLYNPDTERAQKIWKISPGDLDEIDGDWYASGHEGGKGKQRKVAWTKL